MVKEKKITFTISLFPCRQQDATILKKLEEMGMAEPYLYSKGMKTLAAASFAPPVPQVITETPVTTSVADAFADGFGGEE